LAFCASTGTLFMISDALEGGEHLYNIIYELSSTGELLQKWTIVNHFDIEGITCDDKNKLIHILEEENMRVTTFTLPQIDDHQTYFPRNGKNYLLELHSFVLELGGFRENHPDVDGLEDLTWNPKTEEFLLSNANPALLISAGSDGTISQVTHTQYARDIAGLVYDDQLEMLWILSNSAETIFVTDLSGSLVYDSWALPLNNGQGIAINNNADPPRLYVTTDPHSTHNTQYVAALFEFQKPVIGTGLAYPDANEEIVPVACDGCDQVWRSTSKSSDDGTPIVAIVVPLVSAAVLIAAIVGLVAGVAIIRRWSTEEEDPATEMLVMQM